MDGSAHPSAVLRLSGTTALLPLHATLATTPGWSFAIGIATIGTPKLSNYSAMVRSG